MAVETLEDREFPGNLVGLAEDQRGARREGSAAGMVAVAVVAPMVLTKIEVVVMVEVVGLEVVAAKWAGRICLNARESGSDSCARAGTSECVVENVP